MDWKNEIAELRKHIDDIDEQLVRLFEKRMEASHKMASIKCDQNLAVQDLGRENQIVNRALTLVNRDLKSETALLMRTIMSLSREYQRRILFSGEAPMLPPPSSPITENVTCAYQGLPGAWSEQAATCMFPGGELVPVNHFEDVFVSVRNEKADYGVVPIENSKTGAIGETYDLLRKYGCYIVGRTWVSIRQNLIGVPGTSIKNIRKIFSHPEGFRQCSQFLNDKHWDQTTCRNTAVAAEYVAREDDKKNAAIASARAAELYGLEILAPDIMDAHDNRTSFVVIARNPEYNHKSDLISVTFSTLHRSGALCEALMPFMADNINLTRIESRPVTADKYRFFAEIQGNIMDDIVVSALRHSAAASEYFEILGCYTCTDCE